MRGKLVGLSALQAWVVMSNNGSKRVRFNGYEVDLETGELWKRGVALKLAGQPFEILAYLVQRPRQLVSREELRAQLWPQETFVDFDHGLNAAVNKLRLVLCDSAENPKYIETLPRRGYRFIAPVEGIALKLEDRTVKTAEPPHSSSAGQEWIASPTPAKDESVSDLQAHPAPEIVRTIRTNTLWLLYGVMAALAFAGFWMVQRKLHSTGSDRTAAATETAVKLSPITNLSDRTSQPAFSPDGSRVAFVRDSFLPENTGIWSKQVDGEELVQLTNHTGDCCPKWSPDGQWVAFSRFSGARRRIDEVASHGGKLRELLVTDPIPEHGELDWSADGRTIAYVGSGTQGPAAIFLLSVNDRTTRQVTTPSAFERDWGPAFSPDGGRIVFVRKDEIMVLAIEGKEIQRLTKAPGRVIGSPAWTPDGQSIVFAAINQEGPTLMRVPASGGNAIRIPEAGTLASNPAISKRGFRLACDQLTVASNIDEIDLFPPGRKARTLVTTNNGGSGGIQVSHDGKRLVFQSNRAGESDIWVSDRDGQNPVRMTAVGTASAPRWSPDDKEIAFEAASRPTLEATQGIYLLKSSGGEPWPLIQDNFNNRAPRWSNDGNWIYFGSNRSGDWQVWKVQAWGGSPTQVTHNGGIAAEESLDGKNLFFVKQGRDLSEIWKMLATGGPETLVSPAIHPTDWAAWAVVKDGLLFVESGADNGPTVNLLDFSSEHVKPLTVLDKPPFWLATTRDGRSVIFDQPGQLESRVMLLENFR